MVYLLQLTPDASDGVQLPPGRKSLGVWDVDASHLLKLTPGSNLSADRTLAFLTGDADRVLTLAGDATLNDWFDQSVKSTATPSFAGLTSSASIAAAAPKNSTSLPTAGGLVVRDASSAAQGVGGAVLFEGAYTGSTTTTAAAIHAFKTNATPGDTAFDLAFHTRVAGGDAAEKFRIGANGNIGLGRTTFDAAGARVLAIASGSAPAAGLADTVQLYAGDRAAGKAGLLIKAEDGATHIWSDRVGIGTTSPGYLFQVTAVSGSDGVSVHRAGADRILMTADGVFKWGITANQGALTWDTGKAIVSSQSGSDLRLSAGGSTGNHLYVKQTTGNIGIGHDAPDTILDINGALTFRERSVDPSDPDEGAVVLWMSNGSGSGDDGDLLIKVRAGGVTKTVTLVDFSAS